MILESVIQEAIVTYLRYSGFLVLEFAKPGTHKALAGVLSEGIPDLLAIKDGRYFWVEVKAPGKYPSKKQYAIHQALRDYGAAVIVARSLEECATRLREQGLEMLEWT